MPYSTTITKKGQITIPKPFRDALKLEPHKRIFLQLLEKEKELRVMPAEDLLEAAKHIKVRRKIDPVKAREYMETHYERA